TALTGPGRWMRRARIAGLLLAGGGLTAPGTPSAAPIDPTGAPAVAVPPPAESPAASPTLTLEEAIAIALRANPDLAAARAGRPVAEAAIRQALERPNPDLALEVVRETPKQAATFLQPIELAGKRRKREDVAKAALRSSEGEVASAEADV